MEYSPLVFFVVVFNKNSRCGDDRPPCVYIFSLWSPGHVTLIRTCGLMQFILARYKIHLCDIHLISLFNVLRKGLVYKYSVTVWGDVFLVLSKMLFEEMKIKLCLKIYQFTESANQSSNHQICNLSKHSFEKKKHCLHKSFYPKSNFSSTFPRRRLRFLRPSLECMADAPPK